MLQKLKNNNSNLFQEHINKKEIEIMKKNEFKNFLYDVCSDCDCHSENKYCTLIEFLCGNFGSHRTIIQLKCVEKLKYERHEDINWDIAFQIWIKEGYARKFAEYYDESISFRSLYRKILQSVDKEKLEIETKKQNWRKVMSADNGIYILKTEGPEFRVSYMTAIDNLYWDENTGNCTRDEEIVIRNAREMFQGCKVFTDESEAVMFAFEQSKQYDFLEYGIQTIVVNKKF
jgi:hypothetical protein